MPPKKKVKLSAAPPGKPRSSISRKKVTIFSIVGLIAVVSAVIIMLNGGPQESIDETEGGSSSDLVSDSRREAIQKFASQFCGLNSTANSNEYVIEYDLPGICEMPLGIGIENGIDGNSGTVWYVSTKNGTLGRYSIDDNKFGNEVPIPLWPSRQNPISSSQVWDVKISLPSYIGSRETTNGSGTENQSAGVDIWLTDEQQNAIWKYSNSTNQFEVFYVPESSEAFGTTYPVSLEIDEQNNRIYFVGIRSPSIWIGDLLRMKNGTSDGIEKIELPINNFSGLADPELISTGSIAFDRKNEALWVSVLAFNIKGQIFRYDLKNDTFRTYDLPSDIRSPVGLAITYDNYGENNNNVNNSYIWGTDHATNIFFRLDPITGNITKFATSQLSPRVYGSDPNMPLESSYTLPYWIKSESGLERGNQSSAAAAALWFNEHTGNKIASFHPINSTLIEYWIPTQNKLWGSCGNADSLRCGIANALQFDVGEAHGDEEVWFTEWTENKIGKILTDKDLPFSVNVSSPQISVKRGDSINIQLDIISNPNSSHNKTTTNMLNLLSSGSFSPSGSLVNATGLFSQQTVQLGGDSGDSRTISFVFTPQDDLEAGEYTLMLGAETEAVSVLKAVSIEVI